MKLSLVERETILLYNQAEPMAEIYTHDPRLMEKLELLAKKHPDQITRKDAHNFPPLFGKQHHAHLYAEAGRHIGSRIQ